MPVPVIGTTMANDDPTEMTVDERDTFLGTGGTGVISLGSDNEAPLSVPVSYGYDQEDETFYFRLSVGADGSKGELKERPVSFVTYRETENGWQSVVARGHLEDVEKEGIETASLAGLEHVDIPLIPMFDRPIREISFEFYRLLPDKLIGRTEI
jgi:nitroimidazol reductase NimA-like FMN-containing flavoprotein (pyridoxamine 5'-phosphate oxidase superfamily)